MAKHPAALFAARVEFGCSNFDLQACRSCLCVRLTVPACRRTTDVRDPAPPAQGTRQSRGGVQAARFSAIQRALQFPPPDVHGTQFWTSIPTDSGSTARVSCLRAELPHPACARHSYGLLFLVFALNLFTMRPPSTTSSPLLSLQSTHDSRGRARGHRRTV
ncbi:hypothetical protein EXIGLDRAFT_67973 [Exidia glandulosa HHB12029]|uniref:Uncharacterized protein n=1 Tax=Exidia glandulosa HHB12029 TaxID=1314781 RepID=A0A165I208_EXIGL|nr:hypothetical protein EXIGLDRAFT_67973 [Exidia glandulosa HHB12029]